MIGLIGCASSPSAAPRIPEPERSRALDYSRRGVEAFRAGEHGRGLQLATAALVVRLAACGYECAEVGHSFVQLGDMRYQLGQLGWAAQSYKKALEVLHPHAGTEAEWIAATQARLARACARERHPACPK
jgi:hypothetical protein